MLISEKKQARSEKRANFGGICLNGNSQLTRGISLTTGGFFHTRAWIKRDLVCSLKVFVDVTRLTVIGSSFQCRGAMSFTEVCERLVLYCVCDLLVEDC